MASRARKKDARPRSVPSPGGKRRTIGAGEASGRIFRAIFSAAPDPILLISLKPNLSPGLILEANPAAARLFGYSREELLRRTPRDIADPALGLKLAAIRKALLRKGRCTFPARILTKAGKRLEVENNLIVFALARRKVLLTICRDLSERRRMEKALRESDKKYRNLFDNLPQKVFYKDTRSVYLAVNPSFAADFKIPPEQIAGKSDYDFFPRKLADKYRRGDLKILATGRTEEWDESYLRDGETRAVHTLKSPIRDNAGKIIGILGIFWDVTESQKAQAELGEYRRDLEGLVVARTEELEKYRRRLEDLVRERTEQLRRSEEIFRIAAQSTSDLIYDWDIANGRLEWLGNIDRALGYESGEFPRTIEAWEVAIHPEDRDRVTTALQRHLENRDPWEQEYRVHKKDGSYCHWVDHGTALWGPDGRAYKMIGSCADITFRKQMEEELLKAQKLESVGLLAGGIAHDFNNILTGILGHISLAKLITPPGSKVTQNLGEAEKSCLRAKSLTQQLLTFSRGGAPVKRIGELAALLNEAAEFVLHGSRTRRRLELAPDLWPVEMDEGQISQVVNNIVLNADQAMPEGGAIAIRAENVLPDLEAGLPLPEGPYLVIAISDQGLGIPPDHLSRIFDPYFTTKQKGSGLGLAIAYSIVKNHGGSITVESEMGKGSTFFIHLPAVPGAAVMTQEAERPPLAGKGRILVVDDEETVREVAVEILAHLGYQPASARGSSEAIGLIRKNREAGKPFAAVIMDLTMPGDLDGKAAAAKILEIDPGARIIVPSGYAVSPIMSAYADYGFAGAIAKPYKIRELSEVLQAVLVR